jgi:hypothetical protein
MSLSTGNVCPAILTSLSDNLINNPANVQIMGGTLAALTDPSNLRAGQIIRQANDNGSGHTKEVRVVYKQRQLASDAVDTKSCEAGPQMNYIEETLQINNFKQVSFTLSEAQLRTFCDSYSQLVQLTGSSSPGQIAERANGIGAAQGPLSVVREMFVDVQLSANALVQAINIDLLGQIQSAAGNWYGGATNPSYTVEGADGSIYAAGLFNMKQNYMNTGFNGSPIIIGGAGALQRVWMNDSRYFGQGANGINFSTVRDNTGLAEFYFDSNANTILGDEDAAIVFAPGSIVYTPFLEYVGNFGNIGTMTRFTMPLPGLERVSIDCRILPSECEETYSFFMQHYYDTYSPGTSMFPAGDANEGVNGVFTADFVTAVAP